MSQKTEKAYTLLFQFIKAEFSSLMSPQLFISDFERAIQNTLEAVFPLSQHVGCWFHFGQVDEDAIQFILL